jgi:hypothetical protein
VVTLTNPTDHAISLRDCPGYDETMNLTDAQYELNCAAGAIPAGGSLRFAMQLSLAADPTLTPLGPHQLEWNLIAADGFDVGATATVTVTG